MIDPKLVEQVARVLHSAYCGCDERPNGHAPRANLADSHQIGGA